MRWGSRLRGGDHVVLYHVVLYNTVYQLVLPASMDSRISVDSLQLWLHIKHQYSNAHIALLDAQLPTSTYRDLCIQHIHHYIDSLFAIAKPNLRVNGRNFEDLNENDQGT